MNSLELSLARTKQETSSFIQSQLLHGRQFASDAGTKQTPGLLPVHHTKCIRLILILVVPVRVLPWMILSALQTNAEIENLPVHYHLAILAQVFRSCPQSPRKMLGYVIVASFHIFSNLSEALILTSDAI
jgi:hypothetical protein